MLIDLVTLTKNLVTGFVAILPSLLAALLLLLSGWIFASILSGVFKKLLVKTIKLERFLEIHKLDNALGEARVSDILTKVVYWWILLMFIGEAATFVYLGMISDLLSRFIRWMPNLLYAVLTIVVGFLIADLINEKIKETKIIWSSILAPAVKLVVMVIVLMTAFSQVGVDVSFIGDILKILTAGLTLGFALAIGIAFGWGLKDETPKLINAFKKELKKSK